MFLKKNQWLTPLTNLGNLFHSSAWHVKPALNTISWIKYYELLSSAAGRQRGQEHGVLYFSTLAGAEFVGNVLSLLSVCSVLTSGMFLKEQEDLHY